jgi:hypothetical protein
MRTCSVNRAFNISRDTADRVDGQFVIDAAVRHHRVPRQRRPSTIAEVKSARGNGPASSFATVI